MSIVERLNKNPLARERTLLSPRKILELSSGLRFLEVGKVLLKEAGAIRHLEDLSEHIRSDFPDVRVNDVRLRAADTVEVSMDWDKQDLTEGERKSNPQFEYKYKTISIFASIVNKEIIVAGEEGENLTESQWRNPETLEDSIVRIFKKPYFYYGPFEIGH